WLDIPALIAGAERVYEFPMVDRDPLPRWSFGRTTLLGDAAHPMYPIGSNGASQAILDAEALALALQQEDDVGVAIERYEATRRPATSAIVHSNRQMGPERVMQIVEERAPNGFDRLDDVISHTELTDIAAQYKRIAGFDPESLNRTSGLAPARSVH
ncbi:MAG: FAD-dependent monooxygenase, partial [Betaproteobacteria bacterium]